MVTDSNVTSHAANSYTVEFERKAGDLLVIDVVAAPEVPVPAAAWLFGSA